MATTKAAKEIIILKRAEVLKASESYAVAKGDVVFLVRGEKNSTHVTTLRNNGRHTCTCRASASFGKNCYHIKGCEKVNNARIEAAKVAEVVETPEEKESREWSEYRSELAVKLAQQYMTVEIVEQVAESLVEMPAQEQVPPIAMELPVELKGYRKTAVSVDISTKGNLNGTREFSVLRKVG
jgi:hypothetical protein